MPFSPVRFATRWAAVALGMLAAGCALSFGLMAVFDAAFALMRLIWVECRDASGSPLFPLLPAIIAGVVLSLVVAKYGEPIPPLEAASDATDAVDGLEAIAPVDNSGRTGRTRPLLVRLLDFLTPFAGGGPAGVAMGMSGLAFSGCRWV